MMNSKFTTVEHQTNLHWSKLSVQKATRNASRHQHPMCIWLTGLSGSGKTTIADLLEIKLHSEGYHSYILDGDNLRQGLNSDLGFSNSDRIENIRRVAEVSRLMVDAGLIVITSFISPFRAERGFARSLLGAYEFFEIFVDTPIEECARRDPKGLYEKARNGQLPNFTGIDSPYEVPLAPEVHLHTLRMSPEACVAEILAVVPLQSSG